MPDKFDIARESTEKRKAPAKKPAVKKVTKQRPISSGGFDLITDQPQGAVPTVDQLKNRGQAIEDQAGARESAKQARDEKIARRQARQEQIRRSIQEYQGSRPEDYYYPENTGPVTKKQVAAEVDRENRITSSDYYRRAIERAHARELIEQGLSPEEATAQAAAKFEAQRQAFLKAKSEAAEDFASEGPGFREADEAISKNWLGVKSLLNRIVGDREAADIQQAQIQGISAAMEQARKREPGPFGESMDRGLSGALDSYIKAQPGILAGGVGAAAGLTPAAASNLGLATMSATYGADRFNSALYEAEQAGIGGNERVGHALYQATVEASVMPIFAKFMPTFEAKALAAAMGRRTAQKAATWGARAGVTSKAALSMYGAEIAEELSNELLQEAEESHMFGRPAQYGEVISETVKQTIFSTTLLGGANAAARRATSLPPEAGGKPSIRPVAAAIRQALIDAEQALEEAQARFEAGEIGEGELQVAASNVENLQAQFESVTVELAKEMGIPGGQATPAPPVGTALGPHGVNIGQFVQQFKIPGGQATPAPPVGTALGPHGVNIGQFVQQFNDQTREMAVTVELAKEMGIDGVLIPVQEEAPYDPEVETEPVEELPGEVPIDPPTPLEPEPVEELPWNENGVNALIGSRGVEETIRYLQEGGFPEAAIEFARQQGQRIEKEGTATGHVPTETAEAEGGVLPGQPEEVLPMEPVLPADPAALPPEVAEVESEPGPTGRPDESEVPRSVLEKEQAGQTGQTPDVRPDITDGTLRANIVKNTGEEGGFNVSFTDIESGETLPNVRIGISTLEKAESWARKQLGRTARQENLSGPPFTGEPVKLNPIGPSEVLVLDELTGEQEDAVRAQWFTPGRILPPSGLVRNNQVVLDYKPNREGAGWEVTVQEIDNEGNPLEPPRTHKTQPSRWAQWQAWTELQEQASQESPRAAVERQIGGIQPELEKVARARYENAQDADIADIVQDATLSILEKAESYDPSKPFLPWARQNVRWRGDDAMRKADRRPEQAAEEGQLETTEGRELAPDEEVAILEGRPAPDSETNPSAGAQGRAGVQDSGSSPETNRRRAAALKGQRTKQRKVAVKLLEGEDVGRMPDGRPLDEDVEQVMAFIDAEIEQGRETRDREISLWDDLVTKHSSQGKMQSIKDGEIIRRVKRAEEADQIEGFDSLGEEMQASYSDILPLDPERPGLPRKSPAQALFDWIKAQPSRPKPITFNSEAVQQAAIESFRSRKRTESQQPVEEDDDVPFDVPQLSDEELANAGDTAIANADEEFVGESTVPEQPQPGVAGEQKALFQKDEQGQLFNVQRPKKSTSAGTQGPSELEKIEDGLRERSKEMGESLPGQQELPEGPEPSYSKTGGGRAPKSLTYSSPESEDKRRLAARDIIKTWGETFGVPIKQGGFKARSKKGGQVAGLYKWIQLDRKGERTGPASPEIVRLASNYVADLATAIHEVAHHVDETEDISRKHMPEEIQKWITLLDYEPGRIRKPTRGGIVDRTPEQEGFAEFIRMRTFDQKPEVPPVPDGALFDVDNAALEEAYDRVSEWFEKFLESRPELKKKLNDARDIAREYSEQPIFNEVSTLIDGRKAMNMSFKKRFNERMRSAAMRTTINFIDHAAALEEFQKEARKRGDKSEVGVYDYYYRYLMSSAAEAATAMENGVHAISTGRAIGKKSLWGLNEHLASAREYPHAVIYALARHTLFMRRKRPGYFTNLDAERAAEIISEAERKGQAERFEAFADHLAEFADDTIQLLNHEGALPDKDRDRILKAYTETEVVDEETGEEVTKHYYFPLIRVKEHGDGMFRGSKFVNLGTGVRRRTKAGSGEAIIDPVDALMRLTMQRYARAGQARVLLKLIQTADPKEGGVGGMGGFLDRVDPKDVVTTGLVEEFLQTLVDGKIISADDARAMKLVDAWSRPWKGVKHSSLKSLLKDIQWFLDRHDSGYELPSEKELEAMSDDDAEAFWHNLSIEMQPFMEEEGDLETEIALWRQDYSPQNDRRYVRAVMPHSGEEVLYQMDEDLWKLATGATAPQLEAATRLMRELNRAFKAGAINMSTAFGAANLFSDYVEYQGKAREAGAVKSKVKPIQMLVGYTIHKLAGGKTDNKFWKSVEKATGGAIKANDPAFKLFDEMGGDLHSAMGRTAASHSRYRRKKIIQGHLNRAISKFNPISLARGAVDKMQAAIAISDAPPRLTELAMYLENRDYRITEDGQWKWPDGETRDYLPEEVRIGAMVAASRATVDFKPIGRLMARIDAVMPLANANVQSQRRQAQQLKNAWDVITGQKEATDADKREARNTVAFLAFMVAAGVAEWMGRADDDDWRNMPPWLKDNYWTTGANGYTLFRVRKPRDYKIISNAVIHILDSMYHEDGKPVSDKLSEVFFNEIADRVPGGGGIARGTYEALSNWDYFRGREIVSPWLAADHPAPENQFTAYTLETSKAMSRMLASYFGKTVSPLYIEHVVNSATGGAYRRLVGFAEDVAHGEVNWAKLGPSRAFVVDRFQTGAIDEFYKESEEVAVELDREESQAKSGIASKETFVRNRLLTQMQKLMADIREAERRDSRNRRTFDYQPYLSALALDALDRRPQASSPNIFNMPADEVPEPIRKHVEKFVKAKIDAVILGKGIPRTKGTDDSYEQTLKKWRYQLDADARWLAKHKNSEFVREAQRKAPLYKFAKRPKRDYTKESHEHWKQRFDTWKWHKAQSRKLKENLRNAQKSD